MVFIENSSIVKNSKAILRVSIRDESFSLEFLFDNIQKNELFCNDKSFFVEMPDSKYNFRPEKTPDRGPSSVGITDTPSGSSAFASKSDSTEHLERLRQKLHQLRSLPSTSYDFAEQRVAVSVESPPPQPSTTDLDQDELLDMIYERRPTSTATSSKENPSKPIELQFLGNLTIHLIRLHSIINSN